MIRLDSGIHSAMLLIIPLYRENDQPTDFGLIKINDNGAITALITCWIMHGPISESAKRPRIPDTQLDRSYSELWSDKVVHFTSRPVKTVGCARSPCGRAYIALGELSPSRGADMHQLLWPLLVSPPPNPRTPGRSAPSDFNKPETDFDECPIQHGRSVGASSSPRARDQARGLCITSQWRNIGILFIQRTRISSAQFFQGYLLFGHSGWSKFWSVTRLRPAPHGCVFHPFRCDPSRCVHVLHGRILTDRNATHEKRISVGRG